MNERELIKPKMVEITHTDEDGEKTYKYIIGKYPALDGLDMIEYVAEIFKNGLNFNETRKGLLKECMIKLCKYVDALVISPSGNEERLRLNNELLIDSTIPNSEVALQLMMKVHDYNTFFLKTENLSKLSNSTMDRLKGLITQIFAQ